MEVPLKKINEKGEKVLDSNCGIGGFIVSAMNSVIEKLTERMTSQYGEKDDWQGEIREQEFAVAAVKRINNPDPRVGVLNPFVE